MFEIDDFVAPRAASTNFVSSVFDARLRSRRVDITYSKLVFRMTSIERLSVTRNTKVVNDPFLNHENPQPLPMGQQVPEKKLSAGFYSDIPGLLLSSKGVAGLCFTTRLNAAHEGFLI